MAFKKFGGKRPYREMHKGSWTCSDCGAEITELPFEPSPERPVYCRECWTKKRAERGK
jgi:CxxC-x17-CxxC domain-containing protein